VNTCQLFQRGVDHMKGGVADLRVLTNPLREVPSTLLADVHTSFAVTDRRRRVYGTTKISDSP